MKFASRNIFYSPDYIPMKYILTDIFMSRITGEKSGLLKPSLVLIARFYRLDATSTQNKRRGLNLRQALSMFNI